ncbi:hypothetical protein [Bradyrhizobium sp. LCT2]|uniref:hypothetical protein n=1 Tax=Bradyrhizobium sp. LCT2 TaxID=2493093 RepID=UPI001FED34BA|nr:hypothetical protein [Bradyrhizobium sp. LCT2]
MRTRRKNRSAGLERIKISRAASSQSRCLTFRTANKNGKREVDFVTSAASCHGQLAWEICPSIACWTASRRLNVATFMMQQNFAKPEFNIRSPRACPRTVFSLTDAQPIHLSCRASTVLCTSTFHEANQLNISDRRIYQRRDLRQLLASCPCYQRAGHLAATPLCECYDMDAGAADIAATRPEAGADPDTAANGGNRSPAALLQQAFEKALVSVATQVISDSQSDMDDAMSELDEG